MIDVKFTRFDRVVDKLERLLDSDETKDLWREFKDLLYCYNMECDC